MFVIRLLTTEMGVAYDVAPIRTLKDVINMASFIFSKVTESPATKKFGHVVMAEIKVDTICGPSHKPKFPYCPLWE